MSTNIKNYDLDNPFFSVIMPIYNKEPYIERAVNSILNQKYQNFEIIIVCDPSTDNSNKVVAQLTDPRIRVFHRDEPGPGGYAARNLGIKHAKADWICFLDADDIWLPHHLSLAFKHLRSQNDYKIYVSDIVNENRPINKDLKFKEEYSNVEYLSFYEYHEQRIFGKKRIDTNTIIVKRDILSCHNWFPEGRAERSGDLYLWTYLLAYAKKMMFVNSITSVYYTYIVGVSKTALPSLTLNYELFDEISPLLNNEEKMILKRYINRLQTTAYFEYRRRKYKLKFLFQYFYLNKEDVPYLLKWQFISLFPIRFFDYLIKMKSKMRRVK